MKSPRSIKPPRSVKSIQSVSEVNPVNEVNMVTPRILFACRSSCLCGPLVPEKEHMIKPTAQVMRRWLASRHLPVIAACIGVVLTLPSLSGGLAVDDYVHRQILLGQWQWPVKDASLFGLFTWFDPANNRSMMEAGLFPWWTYDKARAAFWRPLSELTHWLDYRLWPGIPALMHAQNLLWFFILLWVVVVLYRRMLGETWIAGLAGILFALDAGHALPAIWVANRNATICGVFSVLAFLAYDRWRRDSWRPGAIMAPLAYLLGLLGGEATLSVLAYLFAYAVFIDRADVRRRFLSLTPFAALTLAWGFVYHHFAFGIDGIGAYIDPLRQPATFLAALFERAPILILGHFAEPPADPYGVDLYKLLPYGEPIVWSTAVAFLAAMLLIMAPLFRRNRVVYFWTTGMLLGLVPACAAFPSNRLLLLAGIGGTGIIAMFMGRWFDKADLPCSGWLWRSSTRALYVLFFIVHLIVSPLMLFGSSVSFSTVLEHAVVGPALALPYGDDIREKTVVIVNAPVALASTVYGLVRQERGLLLPRATYGLASGFLPLTLTRVDARSFDIECDHGLLVMGIDQLPRGRSKPMHVGQRIELPPMSVEVRAIVHGWQPSCARFTFRMPLDDPSLLFLQWKDGRFVPYKFPEIGRSGTLPRTGLG